MIRLPLMVIAPLVLPARADTMLVLGAYMTTHSLKAAGASYTSVAPTVIVVSSEAGEVVHASVSSFPAATTTTSPPVTALRMVVLRARMISSPATLVLKDLDGAEVVAGGDAYLGAQAVPTTWLLCWTSAAKRANWVRRGDERSLRRRRRPALAVASVASMKRSGIQRA